MINKQNNQSVSSKDVQVLRTDDFLYYVIIGDAEVIKEKAIEKAENLKRQLTKRRDKIE